MSLLLIFLFFFFFLTQRFETSFVSIFNRICDCWWKKRSEFLFVIGHYTLSISKHLIFVDLDLLSYTCCKNKAGLQLVSRPVEKFNYIWEVWLGAWQHLWCRQTDKQTDRAFSTSSSPRNQTFWNFFWYRLENPK